MSTKETELQLTGKFLGVPYDLRFPTPARIRERVWNPDDPRIIVPRVFGAGWTLNLYSLRSRSEAAFYLVLGVYALMIIGTFKKAIDRLRGPE